MAQPPPTATTTTPLTNGHSSTTYPLSSPTAPHHRRVSISSSTRPTSTPPPRPIKHVHLTGSPLTIGQLHGTHAHTEVHGSLNFYRDFFHTQTGLSWDEVTLAALKFQPFLNQHFPQLVEEMKGISMGAGCKYEDVLALNVRTEIAYGMQKMVVGSDGCTAFSWKDGSGKGGQVWLAQNWDWSAGQRDHLVVARVEKQGKPKMVMVTEAGIVGKIGLNEKGVGVTLNAVSCRGVDFGKVPVHLALRAALECRDRGEAEELLRGLGVASSCHIQVADRERGGLGLECTAEDVVVMEQDGRGVTTHSNHLVREHKKMHEGKGAMLQDTFFRLDRVGALLGGIKRPTKEALQEVLRDEGNAPCAINRGQTETSAIQTLFSIVMDLTKGEAYVKMGRPSEDGEEFVMRP